MPVSPTYPGVYIEEISSGVRTITGVATSITAFIGRAKRGPTDEPVTINSYGDYERIFGGLWNESSMSYAVRDFYLNGGNQAIIVRLYNPAYSEEEQATAYLAATTFANMVVKTANVADIVPTGTMASVKTEIEVEADAYENGEHSTAEKGAVRIVARYALKSPNSATVQCLKDVARQQAQADANGQDPEKTSVHRVVTAVNIAARQTDASPESVVQAAYEEVKTIDTESNASMSAANAVFAAASSSADSPDASTDTVMQAAQQKAKESANLSADRVFNALEDMKTVQAMKEAAGTEANKVADEADRQKNAAKQIADAIKKKLLDAVKSIGTIAQAAAELATPHPKAQLQVGTMLLEAANEGAWANHLRVRIDYEGPNELPKNYEPYADLKLGDLFNLIVRDGETGLTEVFRNVTVKPSSRQVDKVLQNESKLIRVREFTNDRPNKNKDLSNGQNPWTNDDYSYKVTVSSADGAALDQTNFTGRGEKAGLYALENADLFNLLCIPPCLDDPEAFAILIEVAAQYCEKRRAMLIVDPPSEWINKEKAKKLTGVTTRSKNAALFFPRLKQPNPLHDNQVEEFVPCGVVAGIFARTDSTRGIWKAPAGLEATLVGVPELSVSLTDLENGELNQLGINCLRTMPGVGRVVWGARTLQGNDRLASEWKYIPVRRLALFIEESLYRGTQWVVFEPNDEPLWAQIRLNIGAFMNNLFRQGAFQGRSPRDAYFVKCDKETTTQNDINLGIVNIVVGFAPLKPAEFVIIQLQQMAGQIQV